MFNGSSKVLILLGAKLILLPILRAESVSQLPATLQTKFVHVHVGWSGRESLSYGLNFLPCAYVG